MQETISINNHPAVLAWRKVDPPGEIPIGIEELNKDRKKSKIFRLTGIGPENLTVIAKGGKLKNLQMEQVMYQKVLPDCNFPTLKCYGFVKNEEEGLSWLFLEDAQGEVYDRNNKQHQMAIMQWLGALHTSCLPEASISLLPDRGLNCYHEYLQKARANILENSNNPNLANEQITLLKEIAFNLESIASKWSNIEISCSLVPLSFIHGDFKPRNIRIRRNKSSYTLIAFDWEMAGWGVPTIDLGVFGTQASKEQLTYYWSAMTHLSPNLNFQEVQHLVYIGIILRLTVSIYWESLCLNSQWIIKPMERLSYYQKHLSSVFVPLGW